MLKKDSLKDVAYYNIYQLVDKPDEINIKEQSLDGVIVIDVRVNKDDVGRVVGRKGQTVEAIRSILHCLASKKRQRILLQVEQN